MSIVNLIKTALYSIKAHKLRVFLTMIGIIIGISSTVAMKSIGDGLTEYMINSMQESGSNVYQVYFSNDNYEMDNGMVEYFDENDIADIQAIEGITKVEAATNMGTSDQIYGSLNFFGSTYETYISSYSEFDPDMKYGKWFNESDDDKKQIVLNYEAAKKLMDNPNEAIGKGVTFNGEIYEVIGVTKKSDSMFDMTSMYCFVSKDNIVDATSSDIIYQVNFTADPECDTDEIFEEVTSLLEKNHPQLQGEYKVYDPSADVELISNVIGGLTSFVTAITGIALFVGGVGVMNIMYVSVTERRREIGIRRAIGAKPKSIMLQFLLEAVIVTVIGGIIGIIFGALLGKLIGNIIPIEGFKSVITLKTLLQSASVSVLVGVLFGIVPASNAAKLDPIKAIYQ